MIAHSAKKEVRRLNQVVGETNLIKKTLQNTLIIPRFKAFVTDLFMIYTPILYIMTYFVLDGAKSFQNNQGAILICFLLYGFLLASFFSAKKQTPGFKYAQIQLTQINGKKVSFLQAYLRFFIWALSMALLIGIFFPFFTTKHQCLHDLICKTKVTLT